MPAAWNHSAISRLSAAEPEMKNRTRPPKRSRTLEKTSLSATAYCALEQDAGRDLPARLSSSYFSADGEGPVEDLLLGPALGRLHGLDPAVGLLEDPRRGAHEGRLHHGEVLDDLVDPAVDGGRRSRAELGARAAPCRTSAPSAATGTAGRPRRGCPGPGSPRPRRSTSPAAAARPWAGRWCRRCRSGWRVRRRRSRRRCSSISSGFSAIRSSPSSARSSSPITQSPSPWPSKVDHLDHRGSSARFSRSFSICSSSSAKTTREPESLRMNAVSSALVDG